MIIDASDDSIEVLPIDRPASRDLINEIAQYPVALIGDVVSRMGMMCSAISAKTSLTHLHGTVLPIKTREGDNLAIHRGLDEAQPGDVVVINANEEQNRAVFGDILGEVCLAKGVVGAVVDGAIRDLDDLDQQNFPVFARSVSPAGPAKNGPGVVGEPVACGSIVCYAGDAIFADRDGVIVLRPAVLASVAIRLRKQAGIEDGLRARIKTLAENSAQVNQP